MIQKVLHKHVGLRAEGMILISCVWILLGVGRLLRPDVLVPSAWHTFIPQDILGYLWISTAATAAVLSLFDRPSNVGLGLLMVTPAIYLSSYLASWFVELIPGPPPGDPWGWFTSLFYLCMILWVLHIARIPADVRAPLYGRKR